MTGFSALEGVTSELAERLVGEGFLSYDDLSIIEPANLMRMGDLSQDDANRIVSQAEQKAEEAEKAAAVERRRQREQGRADESRAREAAAAEAAAVATEETLPEEAPSEAALPEEEALADEASLVEPSPDESSLVELSGDTPPAEQPPAEGDHEPLGN